MDSISHFLDVFYSAPISFYSVPFTILFIIVALSVVGLHFDFNIDIESAEISEGLKVFLSHFNLSRVPIFMYLFTYTMLGSISLLILHDFIGGGLILNIIAVVNIYFAAKAASLLLTPLAPLFEANKEQIVEYVGLEAIVSSVNLDRHGGVILCEQGDAEHHLNAWVEGDDILDKGDRVLILYKEGNRFQVEKLKELN